ncbi:GTP cyclohydrolase I FolE [Lentilactobacillus kefiri]|nr:GTP cyclohydrolase I FolE [Lentilactobacillus kefiri]PAL07820.1 GTP cyclohydrolase I FolE [Lentilactobacillus kefiri]QGV25581.1 GTP cyclohydrolase I FolE [Lentilactobacillus kefiri]
MMQDVYLSLGSNIGNRELYLHKAIEMLGNDPQILIDKVADFYETSPVGGVKQRSFINTAVKIATNDEPLQLLDKIHQIEADLQRVRTVHWGPRTVDIDIIFFGTQETQIDKLTIPHPEAFNRLFVLIPIKQIMDHDSPYYAKVTQKIDQFPDKDQLIAKSNHPDSYKESIKRSVTNLLSTIGEDPNRPGLLETPDRVARMYGEIFASTGLDDFQDYKLFDDPNKDSKMVMIKNIPFYSMCEHHMMPFWGKVNVGYLPKNGKIIGLSKIPRLVDFVSHKLSLQEKITDDIVSQMNKILAPQGVAVVVDARHMCVEMRGVKKTGSITRTTKFSGIFEENSALRHEFLQSL